MRKRIIDQGTQSIILPAEDWLDLESSALAELTSEDASHPIESALKPGVGSGWRASEPGQQTVRLLFDKPLRVKHVHIEFHEDVQPRTQEFFLRWSADGGRSCREIVRQQYTFSPPGNAREIEDYEVDLVGLTVLEISISPDISGGGPLHRLLSCVSHNHQIVSRSVDRPGQIRGINNEQTNTYQPLLRAD